MQVKFSISAGEVASWAGPRAAKQVLVTVLMTAPDCPGWAQGAVWAGQHEEGRAQTCYVASDLPNSHTLWFWRVVAGWTSWQEAISELRTSCA